MQAGLTGVNSGMRRGSASKDGDIPARTGSSRHARK